MSSTQQYLLQRLEGNPVLLEQPWADEAIRWAELVFCYLDQSRRAEPAVTRQAVSILTMLNVVAPGKLAQLSLNQATIVRYVLSEAGWTNEEAETAIAGLEAIARAFIREGGAAKVLREESREMHQRLCSRLEKFGAIPCLTPALGHWLQNACSLPVPVDREEWERFAQGLGYSYDELIRAADDIDLNVALIDDLIREENVL